jgi:hypothetical protein
MSWAHWEERDAHRDDRCGLDGTVGAPGNCAREEDRYARGAVRARSGTREERYARGAVRARSGTRGKALRARGRAVLARTNCVHRAVGVVRSSRRTCRAALAASVASARVRREAHLAAQVNLAAPSSLTSIQRVHFLASAELQARRTHLNHAGSGSCGARHRRELLRTRIATQPSRTPGVCDARAARTRRRPHAAP